MIETLANGYSSESTKRELSNEYQHDRVFNGIIFWAKVASASEELKMLEYPEIYSIPEMLCPLHHGACLDGLSHVVTLKKDQSVFFYLFFLLSGLSGSAVSSVCVMKEG